MGIDDVMDDLTRRPPTFPVGGIELLVRNKYLTGWTCPAAGFWCDLIFNAIVGAKSPVLSPFEDRDLAALLGGQQQRADRGGSVDTQLVLGRIEAGDRVGDGVLGAAGVQ